MKSIGALSWRILAEAKRAREERERERAGGATREAQPPAKFPPQGRGSVAVLREEKAKRK